MTDAPKANKLLWMDLEMTGLDEKRDHILEVAAVVTDFDFNPVDEYHVIVFQPPEVLELMDEWCVKTHGASGLTEAVKTGTPLADVEEALMALTQKHFSESKAVLCGNSIGQDRRFIDAYLKRTCGDQTFPCEFGDWDEVTMFPYMRARSSKIRSR